MVWPPNIILLSEGPTLRGLSKASLALISLTAGPPKLLKVNVGRIGQLYCNTIVYVVVSLQLCDIVIYIKESKYCLEELINVNSRKNNESQNPQKKRERSMLV